MKGSGESKERGGKWSDSDASKWVKIDLYGLADGTD